MTPTSSLARAYSRGYSGGSNPYLPGTPESRAHQLGRLDQETAHTSVPPSPRTLDQRLRAHLQGSLLAPVERACHIPKGSLL